MTTEATTPDSPSASSNNVEVPTQRSEDEKFGFQEVDYPEPHQGRTKELLQEHPEIKEYFETNPWTAGICLGVVGAQVGLAVYMTTQPWWVILLVAYFVGAFLNNATYSIIHEAAHKRIFRGRLWNEIVGWVANFPQLLPTSSSFRNHHLKHHLYQGDPEYDADLASPEEAEWVGRSTFKKIIWQTFYPVFQVARTAKLDETDIEIIDKWVIGNLISQVVFLGTLTYFAGGWAILYLALCFVFSMGLHPLSARLIQEHFIVKEDQETYSYYGPLNKLSLNVYHHNEHHDFPAVPWNHLPKVREIASDVYEEDLYYHTSLTSLWLKFLFDPSMTLYNRIVRDYYNGTVDR